MYCEHGFFRAFLVMDPYSREKLAEKAKTQLSDKGGMVSLVLKHPCEDNLEAKILQAWIRGEHYLVFD